MIILYQDLCTKSTIWPSPISQGHNIHFNGDIVKIQKPDKSSLMSGAVVFRASSLPY